MSTHGTWVIAVLLILVHGSAAAEQESLFFENDSANDIKVVAPGIAFILPAGAKKSQAIETKESLGVQLNIWWKKEPLQLCRLFTPWSRRVLISGKHTIVCRSKDLQ